MNLHESLFNEVNQQLAENGVIVKIGEVSIVDATVIEAHQCRKKPGVNKENAQDPEDAILRDSQNASVNYGYFDLT